MPTGRFSSLSAAVLAAAAMTAAHAMPGMPAGHPAVSMPDRTLFELIAAGVAIHRNDPDFAYAAWMDAAQKERNPEIAELAWQAAVASRQPEKALEAARLWLRLDPKSEKALQTILADAVERNDQQGILDTLAQMEKALSPGDEKKGGWIERLLDVLGHTAKPGAGLQKLSDALAPYAARYPKRADIGIGYAQLLSRSGKLALACTRAETAIRQAPDDPELLGRAADICWPADTAKTRALLSQYLKRHPDDSLVLLISGRVEQRLGERAQALATLDRAMKKGTKDARIALNAGQLAADLNDAARTEKFLLRYVELLREESEEIDLSRLEVWLQMGNAALMQKSPARAAEYFHELQGGPFALQARIREALALTDMGRPDEALLVLKKARETLPLDAAALYSAETKLLLELNRRDDAVKLITEAVEKLPSEPGILYDAAMVEEESGNTAAAEKHLEALVKLSPNHAEALNALGYLWADGNRNLKEARELLERAYKAEPLNPFILDSMGWLCYREGRLRAAAEFTSASLKRLWDAEVAAHLVEILARDGRTAEAERMLADYAARTSTEEAKALADRLSLKLPSLPETKK